MKICFTGYRDKGQEDVITKNGGEVTSFGTHIDALLISPAGKFSSKPDKAKARNIPVMTFDQFAKKYGLK